MENSEIEILPYEPRYWYPHLSPSEARIWDRFVRKNPDVFERVAYDVKVGSVPDFVLEHNDAAIRAQRDLYRYKIDVVAFKGEEVFIIELKQAATMRAIGQVIGYKELLKREYKPASEPKLVIITDVLMPDMNVLTSSVGIQIIVI